MSLPFFYADNIPSSELTLDEETSKHVVQVLRMQEGEHLLLTDGKGLQAEVEIISPHKKACAVKVVRTSSPARSRPRTAIAISLIKNTSRFEWFLEKATELGIHEIVPLLCERTERQKFRYDRMIAICKSAMLQSMQTWLPVLHEPQSFSNIVKSSDHQQKFIAHCAEDEKLDLGNALNRSGASSIVLIGPEGDFTSNEIKYAKDHFFMPVALGSTRLRSETAGIYAAVMLSSG